MGPDTTTSTRHHAARWLGRAGIDQAAAAAHNALFSDSIRVVNYHSVPGRQQDSFQAHIDWYGKCYENVSEQDLRGLLHGKAWQKDRPGIIISFDDGFVSHAKIAAPILEAAGFTGWFFVPTGLIGCDPEEQSEALTRGGIHPASVAHEGERVFMAWDEVEELSSRHVVGAHTVTHRRLGPSTDPTVLRREICGSRSMLTAALSMDVSSFCWVGGEEQSYSRGAADLIRNADFEFGFMTASAPVTKHTSPHMIQRTNIEAHYPLPLVRLLLAGAADLRHTLRRRRIQRLTAPKS
jgi:hypothetical protein